MIKNVILVSIDTLRYDCCGYQSDTYWLEKYGLRDALKTDTLDEFAAKSVCFTNCFSTSSYTTNSHASLFTGLYPPKHGVRPFFKFRLRKGIDTLAVKFKQHGFRTVMMSDNPELFQYTGLDQGFDAIYKDEVRAISDIKRGGGSRVFSFFHFFDVHDPYLFSRNPVSPDHNRRYFEFLEGECKKRGIVFRTHDHQRSYYELFYALNGDAKYFFPLYVRGVSEFDAGRLKRFIGLLEEVPDLTDGGVVMLLSDHGEGRIDDADQGKFRHEGLLYDDVLRVPLIMRHPDMRPAVRDDLFSLTDIMPTLLDFAGIPYETGGHGKGLDGAALGKARTSIYAEYWMRHGKSLFSSFGSETALRQRVIRTLDRKYVLNGEPESIMNTDIAGMTEKEVVKLVESDNAMNTSDVASKGEIASGNPRSLGAVTAMYDLKRDPRELEPENPADKNDAKEMIAHVLAIRTIYLMEKDAIVTEEISLGSVLQKRIDVMMQAAGNRAIAIYGAGEHTARLFKETSIGKAHIVAVVDSDPAKWGTVVGGISVVSPADGAKRGADSVVISSRSFQEEIFEYLSSDPGWSKCEIVRLYDSVEGAGTDREDQVIRQLKSLGYF